MKSDKRNILLSVLVAAVVLSLLMLVVRVNALFLVGYIFALLGLAGVALSACVMLKNQDAYPWITALPRQSLYALVVNLAVSAVAVLLDQFYLWSLSPVWLTVLQVVILGVFAVHLILLRGGIDHIRQTDAAVRGQTIPKQILHSDVLSLAGQTSDPALKTALETLASQVRYADPVSGSPDIAVMDARIRKQIALLGNLVEDPQPCIEQCRQITLLLEERNRLCRVLKGGAQPPTQA